MGYHRERLAKDVPCSNCEGPRYRDGKTGLCVKCVNNKPGAVRTRQRRYIAKQYGLTLDEYEAMLNDPCWLCGTTERRLCVDHDHETGEVRGTLCHMCNSIIGFIEVVGIHVVPRIAMYLQTIEKE